MLQVTAEQLDVIHVTPGFYAGGMKEDSRWWSEAEPPGPEQTRTAPAGAVDRSRLSLRRKSSAAPAGAGSCGGKIPVVDTNRLSSDVPPGLGGILKFPNGIGAEPHPENPGVMTRERKLIVENRVRRDSPPIFF